MQLDTITLPDDLLWINEFEWNPVEQTTDRSLTGALLVQEGPLCQHISDLFVQILMIAKESGWLKLGHVSLDGTKIKANASKHKALSYKYACQLEKQLKQEVAELMTMAEKADSSELPDGLSIPDKIKRREDRLAVISKAKEEIERRAEERYRQEKAEYDEKMERRKERKHPGKAPNEPEPGAREKDQVNLTDKESRIGLLADTGYFSAANVLAVDNLALAYSDTAGQAQPAVAAEVQTGCTTTRRQ